MKIYRAVAAIVVISLIACGAAVAEPTLNGYTGLLTVPTADTLAAGTFNVGVNSGELEDWDDFSYYANFGLGEETEAGLLLFRPDNDGGGQVNTSSVRGSGDQTFLHLKRSISAGLDDGPDIAAGVFDLADEVETTVYVVATWEQGRNVGTVDGREVNFLDVHAGFAGGMIQDFFAGVNLAFGTRVQVMGEFINDDVNIGARFSPLDNITVDAGLLDMDDLAVNVSYASTY